MTSLVFCPYCQDKMHEAALAEHVAQKHSKLRHVRNHAVRTSRNRLRDGRHENKHKSRSATIMTQAFQRVGIEQKPEPEQPKVNRYHKKKLNRFASCQKCGFLVKTTTLKRHLEKCVGLKRKAGKKKKHGLSRSRKKIGSTSLISGIYGATRGGWPVSGGLPSLGKKR